MDGITEDNEISDEARKMVDTLLKQKFRPEFLNRLDEIVLYKPLSEKEIMSIVDLMIEDLARRVENKRLGLKVSKRAKEYIVDQGFDSIYGARPLKRYIQSHVETLIAKMILAHDLEPDTVLYVDYDGNKLNVDTEG